MNALRKYFDNPSGYDSGDKFTVNLDQSTEANYAASDLCYSMPTNFARTDVDTNGRKLLQMKHLKKYDYNLKRISNQKMNAYLKVIGNISATPMAAESPGMQPMMMPIATPPAIIRRLIGVKALRKPAPI